MKIRIHRHGSDLIGRKKYLIVTSNATFLLVTISPPTGHVDSFIGSIWPGELPEIFLRHPTSINSAHYLREEIRDHFLVSVSPIEIKREDSNDERDRNNIQVRKM